MSTTPPIHVALKNGLFCTVIPEEIPFLSSEPIFYSNRLSHPNFSFSSQHLEVKLFPMKSCHSPLGAVQVDILLPKWHFTEIFACSLCSEQKLSVLPLFYCLKSGLSVQPALQEDGTFPAMWPRHAQEKDSDHGITLAVAAESEKQRHKSQSSSKSKYFNLKPDFSLHTTLVPPPASQTSPGKVREHLDCSWP